MRAGYSRRISGSLQPGVPEPFTIMRTSPPTTSQRRGVNTVLPVWRFSGSHCTISYGRLRGKRNSMANERQRQLSSKHRPRFACRFTAAAAVSIIACAAGALSAVAETAYPPHVAATGRNTVEDRVQALSKALALDDHQRAQLTMILETQRAAIAKIWGDSSLLPAERAPATRAVQQHTADQIRQILNKEQKTRYNPPKPISAGRDAVDVSRWLDLARASNSNSSSTP